MNRHFENPGKVPAIIAFPCNANRFAIEIIFFFSLLLALFLDGLFLANILGLVALYACDQGLTLPWAQQKIFP